MKRTLTALTVAATMFASSASAFDPADLRKLLDRNVCAQCDLRGADLLAADLLAADLTAADLFGADLRGADLFGANLASANMNGAFLCNTIMPDGSVIYSGC
ncbi:pentapeptide repeat-containing protein [Ascidiaceihabitans sp.]|nr:pentapeptide repeat-containing protein [Ascidiaceihabitans sp.]